MTISNVWLFFLLASAGSSALGHGKKLPLLGAG